MTIMDMAVDADAATAKGADIEAIEEEEDTAKVVVKSVEVLAKGQSLNLIQTNIVHVMKNKVMIYIIVGLLHAKKKLQMEIMEKQMV